MSAEGDVRHGRLTIAGLVVAGVAVRLFYVGSPGFPADVATFMAWAERLAEIGPGRFYEPGYFADYPPGFLYVLWLLGVLLDGEALRLAVKAISIPFDVLIALIGAKLAWQAGGPRPAVLAAGLWMLFPGAIFAGVHWGQVDAIGTVPFMVALVLAARGRWTAAGACAALAAMIKPQLGLALIVVGAAAAIVWIREGRPRPVLGVGAAAAVVVLALGLPFRAGPLDLLQLVNSASQTYPYSSLYAFNPWSIFVDFWTLDGDLVVSGAMLLAAGIVLACVPLWWRRDTAALLACGAAAVMAFYFLPTRAHERYLFPAFALLLPLVALRPRLRPPYVVLGVAFFTTLVFVFTRYDLATVPALIDATLFTRAGQIGLAVLMTGTALLLLWRLARGEAILSPTAAVAPARDAASARPAGWRVPVLRLPPGLAPGHAPTRRDLIVALLIALAILGTRGYRLDQPREMYFDEVYHARTAFELLAGREVYEWTHPHLAKQLMALGILAFSGDRVTGGESLPRGVGAFAITSDGLRIIGFSDGRISLRNRDGSTRGDLDAGAPVSALAVDGGRLYALAGRELVEAEIDGRTTVTRTPLGVGGQPTALVAAGGRVVIGTDAGAVIRGAGPPIILATPVQAIALRPDGTVAYLLDPQGTARVVGTADGVERTAHPAAGPVRAIAHAPGADRLFLARSDRAALDVIELGSGRRETVSLANVRTGSLAAPPSALAVVPRTQFLYALAGDRVVIVETHGASPYAAVPAAGSRLAVDGTADELIVAGEDRATRLATGGQALSWRLPGVIAGSLLAFFIVLLARRLFRWRHAPLLAGLVVLLDGSMFAQARIGMNDVYVALFLVAGWYFVLAAHAPRRSARVDLIIAGLLFGLGAATKWVAFYTLAGLGALALAVTVYGLRRARAGSSGPLDLLRDRGLNAPFLFACFAMLPLAIYAASYLGWFGGPTIPFGWDLRELTQQMFWYHSGLTAPHPAGSPWWSWPLVLKPVYWYYAPSNGGSAVIYDTGNVILFWAALPAFVWCAIAALRARSATLGLIVVALGVQLIAWLPITRVVFFYHFFTALPWYFLALTAALIQLWEGGRRTLVTGYLAVAAAAFAFFYPFISGLPVPADQAASFFILPTWHFDCQFYPSFRCDPAAGQSLSPGALAARLALPVAMLLVIAAAWLLLRGAVDRDRWLSRLSGRWPGARRSR